MVLSVKVSRDGAVLQDRVIQLAASVFIGSFLLLGCEKAGPPQNAVPAGIPVQAAAPQRDDVLRHESEKTAISRELKRGTVILARDLFITEEPAATYGESLKRLDRDVEELESSIREIEVIVSSDSELDRDSIFAYLRNGQVIIRKLRTLIDAMMQVDAAEIKLSALREKLDSPSDNSNLSEVTQIVGRAMAEARKQGEIGEAAKAEIRKLLRDQRRLIEILAKQFDRDKFLPESSLAPWDAEAAVESVK